MKIDFTKMLNLWRKEGEATPANGAQVVLVIRRDAFHCEVVSAKYLDHRYHWIVPVEGAPRVSTALNMWHERVAWKYAPRLPVVIRLKEAFRRHASSEAREEAAMGAAYAGSETACNRWQAEGERMKGMH